MYKPTNHTKKAALLFSIVLITLLLAEFSLRLCGFEPARFHIDTNTLFVKPDSFLVSSDALGWRTGTGKFHFFRDSEFIFECNVNKDHSRFMPQTDSNPPSSIRKKIAFYGCSFTFGQSVPDTCTFPFYLQSLLPSYSVINKAVPGYGLTQMYLTLKQDIESGNIPDMVIISYAEFHDQRTPMHYNWTKRFRHGLRYRKSEKELHMDYPYARLVFADSLVIDKCNWDDWPKDFPLRYHLSLVQLANQAYDNWHDTRLKNEFSKIAFLTAQKTANLCHDKKIKIVFWGLNKESQVVLQHLADNSEYTTYTSLDANDKKFNCSPLDPFHPNATAHKIYATELFHFLHSNRLIE